MMRLLLGLTLSTLLLCPPLLHAQQTPQSEAVELAITVLAYPAPGEVLLRWAPTTPMAWVMGVMQGYQVERAPLSAPEQWSLLTPEPVRPWLPPRFADVTDQTFLMIVAQSLFGPPSFEATGDAARDEQNRDDEIRQRWLLGLLASDLDSTAADAMGLRYLDAEASPGEEYRYRVSLAPIPEGVEVEVLVDVAPGTIDVVAVYQPPPDAPGGLLLTPGDGQIDLQWDSDTRDGAFIAYDVERSSDGGLSYERLNVLPLVFSDEPGQAPAERFFTDSTAVNYRVYHYRVYGRSVFARQSQPAEASGSARDLTPPEAPFLETGEQVEESTVRLGWTLENPPAPDLEGFLIGHSQQEEGPFIFDEQRLLAATERAATDSRALSHVRNYFVVAARDTAGNVAISLPRYVMLVDTIPPDPPVDLSARVDTLGRVMLSWTRGEEPDLLGYRVFKANAEDHEFTLVSGEPVTENAYVDTVEVETLTRALFYEVAALDRNFNPSEPRRVRAPLPDVVPPVPPVLSQAVTGEGSVALQWVPSSSDDVAAHRVLRRQEPEGDWEALARLGRSADRFVDTAVTAGMYYSYAVQALDSVGLDSPLSEILLARPYGGLLGRGVSDLTVARERERVQLTWAFADPSENHRFVVYRAEGDGAMREYRSAGTAMQFVDARLPAAGTDVVRYAVRVVYADGSTSLLSEEVRVDLTTDR